MIMNINVGAQNRNGLTCKVIPRNHAFETEEIIFGRQ